MTDPIAKRPDANPSAVPALSGPPDDLTWPSVAPGELIVAQDDAAVAPEPSLRATVVAEGTEFKGSFSSECPIVVRGFVEGDLVAPSLMVEPTGTVQGEVAVGSLRSDGSIGGSFDADVALLAGQVKKGTVLRAGSLRMNLATKQKGMELRFSDVPASVASAKS
jgi:hypothetical protein